MSLDVYLYDKPMKTECIHCGNERMEREPFFEGNITHNLAAMASEAGIYKELWIPEELGIRKAGDLTIPLKVGLDILENDPDRFKKLNPSNGWGNYDNLLEFVAEYLVECETHPDADVEVSR